ncbi:PucC family protein, partial [Klebsiella pneumoniae]
FAFTPGQSTSLSGAQNGGVFVGMLTVGIMATGFKIGSLRRWVMSGCYGSGAVLLLICLSGLMSTALNFTYLVVALGFFNGMFAVSAISAM